MRLQALLATTALAFLATGVALAQDQGQGGGWGNPQGGQDVYRQGGGDQQFGANQGGGWGSPQGGQGKLGQGGGGQQFDANQGGGWGSPQGGQDKLGMGGGQGGQVLTCYPQGGAGPSGAMTMVCYRTASGQSGAQSDSDMPFRNEMGSPSGSDKAVRTGSVKRPNARGSDDKGSGNQGQQ